MADIFPLKTEKIYSASYHGRGLIVVQRCHRHAVRESFSVQKKLEQHYINTKRNIRHIGRHWICLNMPESGWT